jgi:hypothetical protein
VTQLPLPGVDFVLRFRGTVERYQWLTSELCWEDDQGRWWWEADIEMLARAIRLPRLKGTRPCNAKRLATRDTPTPVQATAAQAEQ